MKKITLIIYQIFIFLPIFTLITVITSISVILLSTIFGNKNVGYYIPKWWSKLTCWIALCPVTVKGRENLDPKQSYVFISNHQGAFDIFMIYGFLGQNIKWVQKHSLRKIPLVGFASEKAGHVFVNNSSIKERIKTINNAKKEIVNGVSMVVFPEGSRTKTGKLNKFKKGAYQIAIDMNLPIVPITLNGPYSVMKIGTWIINPRRLELIIHKPVTTNNYESEDIKDLIDKTKNSIENSLWNEYK